MLTSKFFYRALACLSVFTVLALSCAAQTTVLFKLRSTLDGPFPNNSLTVTDPLQKTGLRISMPSWEDTCDLSSPAVVCGNRQLLNKLDGFSENPRLMVCFSGPINPDTLQSGIFVLPTNAGSLWQGPGSPTSTTPTANGAIAINQVFYDPTNYCAYGKPDHVLSQDTTYLLVATDGISDANGSPVAPAPEFTQCLAGGTAYCSSLKSAVSIARLYRQSAQIAGAAVFTTMTATGWAQSVHALMNLAPPFVIPAAATANFDVANLASLTWNTAQSAAPSSQQLPLPVLAGVGRIAFGLFASLDFLSPTTGTIAFGPSYLPIGSLPLPTLVSFHVLLPATPPPLDGYPVVLWGHGLGDNQFGASSFIASRLAEKGIATLAIEVTGQGFGAGSTVTVKTNNGTSFTEATPGRGVLLPNKTTIGAADGCIIAGTPIGTRDCNLQTVVDLSAMVRAIRTSAVQTALGVQLDSNRIYYAGQSEGAIFGTLFTAVEPNIRAVVLSVGGGSTVDIARTAITARPLALAYAQQYGLFNVPMLGAPPQPYFNDAMNDNYVFRDQAVVVNEVPGAVAVQAGFESADWLQMLGDPLSFASHLRLQPLAGATPKPVLFLFSKGDLEVPNPANSALIRAAGIQNTSWFLQFDQAVAAARAAGFTDLMDPHPLLSYPTIFSSLDQQSIAFAEQRQAAAFLASDGTENPDPNPLLTAPFQGLQLFVHDQPLPEQLNYFQIPTSYPH